MCKKKRKWARVGMGSLFLGALVLGGLLLGAQPASAQSCVQEQAGRSIVCTANDVRVSFADNITDLSGNPLNQCNTSAGPFSFIADFHVTTGATSRYDIGLYFATDGDPNGDGARTGVCSANIIRPKNQTTGLGSANFVNLDGDACGDINTSHNPQVVKVRDDNVECKAGANGFLSLPNCTSWSQNSGGVFSTPDDAAPGSPYKCSCGIGFPVSL